MEDSQDLSEQSVSTNVAKLNGINWTLFNQVVWKDFTLDLKIIVGSGEIFQAPSFKPFSLYIKRMGGFNIFSLLKGTRSLLCKILQNYNC